VSGGLLSVAAGWSQSASYPAVDDRQQDRNYDGGERYNHRQLAKCESPPSHDSPSFLAGIYTNKK